MKQKTASIEDILSTIAKVKSTRLPLSSCMIKPDSVVCITITEKPLFNLGPFQKPEKELFTK